MQRRNFQRPNRTGRASTSPSRIRTASNVEDAIEKDLLATQAKAQENRPKRPEVQDYVRYVALTGPPSSGKAWLLEALRGDLLPRGADVFALDDPGAYEEIVTTESPAAKGAAKPKRRRRKPVSVDPNAAILDRFVAGWKRLSERAAHGGVVVRVDALHALDKERRDFFEYLVKRVELAVSEGEEPAVFFIVGDEKRELRDVLSSLVRRDDAIDAFEIPPPQRRDVDGVIETVHGPMFGAEEKRALAEYLSSNLGSGGALVMALREAVTHGALRYEQGRWRFQRSSTLEAARSLASVPYYQNLLSELPARARTLVEWLSCHPAPLGLDDLERISPLSREAILDAVEQLRAYRVLEVTIQGEAMRLSLASAGVRDAFYRCVDEKARTACHEAYVGEFSGRDGAGPDDLESLAYHYRQADRTRDSLLTRVKAVRAARETHDVYRVRRLCEAGVEDAKALGGHYNERRRSHIGRFFIKNLIDAEWVRTNYAGVIELVDRYYGTQGTDVPASFTPRYAASLESAGDFDKTDSVIREAQSRIANEHSETHQHLMLIDANRLHTMGQNKEALEVLERITEESLPIAVHSKYYVLLMLVNDGLGNFEDGARFAEIAEKIATRNSRYEDLLRVAYHRIQDFIGRAKYSDARETIRKSVRLATRHRMHRSRTTLYFLAQSVNYEEGHYSRGLEYMAKAIRLATEIGMEDHVNAYKVRSALTYRDLGRYGTAMHILSSARKHISQTDSTYFFATLLLLDLHTAINSDVAADYVLELKKLARQRQSQYRLGLYHQFLADDMLRRKDLGGAVQEYSSALTLYESGRIDDDAARVLISMADAYIASNRFEEANRTLQEAENLLEHLESDEIRAACLVIRLRHEIRKDPLPKSLKVILDDLVNMGNLSMDIKIHMDMSEVLFRAYAVLEEWELARRYFNRYYRQIKEVCSNLPSAGFINEFIQSPRFIQAVQNFKSLRRRTPRQNSCS